MFRFLLKRKMAVGLFVVFIFMFGLYASLKLDRELFPPVSFDQAIVMIDTEDMPATDVEQFVTEPIEEAIEGINGIDDYYSTSM
ncbi:MAG TPA: efflux RND transporter permease subunit, partial [Bacillota bacterium]